MTTWTRTDESGQTTELTVITDDRGYVVSTPEVFAQLLRAAGWTPADTATQPQDQEAPR